MSNGPGRWLFGARPRRRGEGVTDVERTFVDREVVLDQVVAEVIAQIHRKTGVPVDAVRVRDLVRAEWSRHDDDRVRTFLPVLVPRAVLGQLLGI
jgi:hypothetical protein